MSLLVVLFFIRKSRLILFLKAPILASPRSYRFNDGVFFSCTYTVSGGKSES